jgi:predicted nicotinamide N-methyase
MGAHDEMAVARTAAFIRTNLAVAAVPAIGEIHLYHAHPASRLRQRPATSAAELPSPYWAYCWAGGAALARHFLDHPASVAGLRVLDLGSGSGLVGMAAVKAGAIHVLAADVDPDAVVAIGLNAKLNGVRVDAVCGDLTTGDVPEVDLIAIGDLFYEAALAERVAAFLDRCVKAGKEVLIGDPGRIYLPHERLRKVADYHVADFGQNAPTTPSGVYSFEAR